MPIERIKPVLAATSAIAILTACSGADVASKSWFVEAGAQLDEGGLGQPTAYNTGVQNGQINPTVALANRFNQESQDTVNFAFNSAALDNTARAILSQQAHWIGQFPELRFRVYGHTDLVGSNAYNKRLGLRRANAVVNYLVASGISRSRLEAVVSYGETRPLIVTRAPEVRNRRTVTEVTGFVGGRKPTVLDGKYAQVVYREYIGSAVPLPIISAGTAGSIGEGT
ncbi:OmpA family protein [Aliiroseovarius sediminilitoris]|uniref:OmpA family protein n=1 Tax=Aliiroseovarius sediminilitoris TaxID=1173584 RepID=A0A1I0P5J8_9RHOB|nr:OmpA family protein [Aliiroseovarius sediminilitoris]SEW09526.1 OmpA family protein [Aliiroseovarius sediminilitoris]